MFGSRIFNNREKTRRHQASLEEPFNDTQIKQDILTLYTTPQLAYTWRSFLFTIRLMGQMSAKL